MPRAVVLSIRPKHAERLFNGNKRVELRRTRPRLESGDLVLIYVSSPIMELRGQCEVASVIAKPPNILWNEVKEDAAISSEEFAEYFYGADEGYGIYLRAVASTRIPISLETLRTCWARFHPPQTYRYVTETEIDRLVELVAPKQPQFV